VLRAEIPGPEALERALAAPAAARPVPNLGYASPNMVMREQRPPIYTNRDCIKKTWDEKGLPWVSGLVLENTRALAALVQWNWEHGIHFFRRARAAPLPPRPPPARRVRAPLARRPDMGASARACKRAGRSPYPLARLGANMTAGPGAWSGSWPGGCTRSVLPPCPYPSMRP